MLSDDGILEQSAAQVYFLLNSYVVRDPDDLGKSFFIFQKLYALLWLLHNLLDTLICGKESTRKNKLQ